MYYIRDIDNIYMYIFLVKLGVDNEKMNSY